MLDMDGTLLDLAYDNYMWHEHIPAEYARQNSMDEAEARDMLIAKFRSLEGKLQWYCLDHWSEVLDLDVKALHRSENERIDYLPGARDFLESALQHEVRLLLVTNSHLDTLAIKTEVTGITEFFDAIYRVFRCHLHIARAWARERGSAVLARITRSRGFRSRSNAVHR